MNITVASPLDDLKKHIHRLKEKVPQGHISISDETIGIYFPEPNPINVALLYLADPRKPTIPEPTFHDRVDKFCKENGVEYHFDHRTREHVFHYRNSRFPAFPIQY